MPTQNKEVLRIRALPTYTWALVHHSGESHKHFKRRLKNWVARGEKGTNPTYQPGQVYRCPPKDFKALRIERKTRWAALQMGVK